MTTQTAAQPLDLAALDKLEALALAATPREWRAAGVEVQTIDETAIAVTHFAGMSRSAPPVRRRQNAAFIAAANPITILALISQARVAQPESAALSVASVIASIDRGEDDDGQETPEIWTREEVLDMLKYEIVTDSGARTLLNGDGMEFTLEELALLANRAAELTRQAVQPESATGTTGAIQSIDTPDFRDLLHEVQALFIGDDRRAKAALIAHIDAIITDLRAQLARAERALARAGFEDHGAQEWKPPIGPAPRFIEVPAPASAHPDRGASVAPSDAKGKADAANASGLPDGWSLVRGGDDIQLRRADGKWCGYSPEIDSPAHRLTHEFLSALISQSPATSTADAKDAEIGFYKRLSQQAQKEAMRESVRDAVAEALDGLYTCGRVWSAWSYGTMSQDDFAPAGEDDDVVDNITDAAIAAMAAAPSSAAGEGDDRG